MRKRAARRSAPRRARARRARRRRANVPVGAYSHGMQKRLSRGQGAAHATRRPCSWTRPRTTSTRRPRAGVRELVARARAGRRRGAVGDAAPRRDPRASPTGSRCCARARVRFGGTVNELMAHAQARRFVLRLGGGLDAGRGARASTTRLTGIGDLRPVDYGGRRALAAGPRTSAASSATPSPRCRRPACPVLTCHRERSEVEDAFASLSRDDAPMSAQAATSGVGSLRGEAAKLPAFLRRDLLVAWSYRMAFFSDFANLGAQVLLFFYIGKLVPSDEPADLRRRPGHLHRVRDARHRRQRLRAGRAHPHLHGPAPGADDRHARGRAAHADRRRHSADRVGRLRPGLRAAAHEHLPGVHGAVRGRQTEPSGILPALVILLTFIPFVWGLGIAAAAAIVTFKRGGNAMSLGALALGFTSGAFFPLALLPALAGSHGGVQPARDRDRRPKERAARGHGLGRGGPGRRRSRCPCPSSRSSPARCCSRPP